MAYGLLQYEVNQHAGNSHAVQRALLYPRPRETCAKSLGPLLKSCGYDMNQSNSKSVNRIFPGMCQKKALTKKSNLENSMGASGGSACSCPH